MSSPFVTFLPKHIALRNLLAFCVLPLLALPALGIADTAPAAGKTVHLTGADNGKEVTLHPGDILIITLHDPGDGGYENCYVQPRGDLMKRISSDHKISPQSPGAIPLAGNFGNDIYTFTTGPQMKGMKNGSVAEWMRFIALRPFERSDNVSLGSGVQFHVTIEF